MPFALLSVSDKTGLADLARSLADLGFNLISTGGTAAAIRNAGIAVEDVSDFTGFPEILDGRVKTLHPKIAAGVLARRDVEEHMSMLAELGFPTIDVVVVNLYPFARALATPGLSHEEIVEQIDIGGPTLLRAAGKNHEAVTVLVDPADYADVVDELRPARQTSLATKRRLAAKVFSHTSGYDALIANYLGGESRADAEGASWPAHLSISMPLALPMRYGENPHQEAAFYRDPACVETSLATAKQLHGKALSYNNMLDAEGALEMVRDFAGLAPCAAVIVKHSNPCGIALGTDAADAYTRARETDPDSAFGGIVSFSSELTEAAASLVAETFNEVIIAPSFSDAALRILTSKKNLRLLATGEFTPKQRSRIPRGIVGGVLVTDRDLGLATKADLCVVGTTQPTPEDLDELLFAWRCVKWVKSNAIVYAAGGRTLGIGAGQMSRIDSANIGAMKSRAPLMGSYMASDAFFPFRDCVDIAAKHGVKAIIQPGGSVRDEEVIAAANEHGIALVFTGMRHFRH